MRYLSTYKLFESNNIKEIIYDINDILLDIIDEGFEYYLTTNKKGYTYDGEVDDRTWYDEHGITYFDKAIFGVNGTVIASSKNKNIIDIDNLKSLPRTFNITIESIYDTMEQNIRLQKTLSENLELIGRLLSYIKSIGYECYDVVSYSYDNGRNKFSSGSIEEVLNNSKDEDVTEYELRFRKINI